MNNDRRKRLARIHSEVDDFVKEINELHAKVDEAITALNDKVQEVKDNVVGQIEEVRDEEQEAYDNMPESLQNGEKGELAQAAIDAMESAISDIEGLSEIDCPEEPDLGDVVGYLETAQE